MIGLAVAAVVVLLVVGAVALSKRLPHPEQTATHGGRTIETTAERFYRSDNRPGGPDLEDTVGTGSRRDPQPPPT